MVDVFSDQRAGELFELAVPPVPESVSVARLFVSAVARHYGVDDEGVDDVKVAVSESVTNSIKAHGAAGKTSVPVRVRVVCDELACRFEVLDEGGGFDFSTRRDSTTTPPGGLYEGSLGLLLIRALFPAAEIALNDAGGTSVRFSVGRRVEG